MAQQRDERIASVEVAFMVFEIIMGEKDLRH